MNQDFAQMFAQESVMDVQELGQFESVYKPSKEVAFCWLRKQYVQLSTEEDHTEIANHANDSLRIWQAAKAQAVPEVKLSHCVTLTCAQLREAFMFGAPDEDDQEQLETEMTITWSEEGHSGKGYYCYYSELPEEGAIFLDEVIEAQEQKG